jgi:hypothetical protein
MPSARSRAMHRRAVGHAQDVLVEDMAGARPALGGAKRPPASASS